MFRKKYLVLARLPIILANVNENYRRYNLQILANISGNFQRFFGITLAVNLRSLQSFYFKKVGGPENFRKYRYYISGKFTTLAINVRLANYMYFDGDHPTYITMFYAAMHGGSALTVQRYSSSKE